MRSTSVIAVAAVCMLALSAAGSAPNAPETTDEPDEIPISEHPCQPGTGCDMAPLMFGTTGDFHYQRDVHMENNTTLIMENGSTFQVRENAELLLPAQTPRLFTGDTATLGTADDNTLRLVVNNKTGLELIPAATPNVVGGNDSNAVADGVTGATIGGGGSGTTPNVVEADYALVSGGQDNTASGVAAVVVGGEANTASGDHSLAAGQGAEALHQGTFVWSAAGSPGIASTGPDQYIVDAPGGVGVGTSSPASALSVEGDVTPATNATHALGSSDLRWTDVWLSSVIHHDGDLVFENTAGETTSTLTEAGDLNVTGTLSADALEGNGSNLTGVEADELADDSVTTTAIADEEVKTADIANASVTAAKIGEDCAQGQVLKADSTGAWVCAEDVDTDSDTLAELSCTSDEITRYDGTAWICSVDQDTTYDGTDFALSDQSCASGEVVAAVNSTGAIQCVADEDTDSDTLAELDCTSDEITRYDGTAWVCSTDQDTTYTAGDGLELNSGAFELDQTCASDEVLKYDGTAWICSTDQDTTYTASSPIALSGTDFTLSSADCSSGDHWVWNGSAWNCIQSGDITAVSAGTGLSGGGTSGDVSLAIDTTETQSRVTGSCGTDASIDAINSDGTVACETDDDTTYDGSDFALSNQSCDGVVSDIDSSGNVVCEADDDTTYNAGDGLELNSGSFELDQTCASDEFLRWDGTAWMCSTETGDISSITAGTGLSGGASSGDASLSIDTTETQARVTGSCGTDASIDVINSDGTVACEADDDTTYEAGDGLELNGGAFDLRQDCSEQQLLKVDPDTLDWECKVDEDTTYTAGDGLELDLSNEFKLRQDCADDAMLAWNVSGSSLWRCVAKAPDADSLDGLDSTQFLRSDTSDTFTGTQLNVDGLLSVKQSSPTNELHVTKPTDTGTVSSVSDYAGLVELAEDYCCMEGLAIRTGYTSDPDNANDFMAFFDGNDNLLGEIEGDGAGGVSYTSRGADLAEYFPKDQPAAPVEPGNVVGLHDGEVRLETEGADAVFAVSTSPAFVGNRPAEGERGEDDPVDALTGAGDEHAPLAMMGQVPVDVVGPVQAGEELVPTGTGDGMAVSAAATDAQGPVVGIALEAHLDEGAGQVQTLVGPSDPTSDDAALEERVQELEQENQELKQRLDDLEKRFEEHLAGHES